MTTCNCENKNKRIDEIDWLRGFAIFLVVLGHSIIVFPINIQETSWCKFLYDTIYSFHMPLMFAISGFCYSYKDKYFPYLRKKAKRLLIPFFFFCVIQFILKVAFPQLVNRDVELNLSIFKEIFLYGWGYWFLYTLFLVFAIFPIIQKALERNVYITSAIVIVLSLFSGHAPGIFRLNNILYFLPFFTFGFLLKRNGTEKYKNAIVSLRPVWKALILILGIAVLITNGCLYEYTEYFIVKFLEAVAGIVVCVIFVWVLPRLFRVFGRFSAYSMPIYLLNGYLLVASRTMVVGLLGISNPIVIIVFNVIVDFFIAYLIIKYIIAKIPFCKSLFGIAEIK